MLSFGFACDILSHLDVVSVYVVKMSNFMFSDLIAHVEWPALPYDYINILSYLLLAFLGSLFFCFSFP